MNMRSQTLCPVCNSSNCQEFLLIQNLPIYCNLFWLDQDAAKQCPKGDIELFFCKSCSFIWNGAFDPGCLEYTQTYENALDFSPRFQDYAKSLANRLVKHYELNNKTIVEIGSGKGEFLVSLCEIGNNRGIGFDPSYVPLPEHNHIKDKINFVQDLYSEKYAHYHSDFVCCRHTLEHVQHPTALLKILRQAIGNRYDTGIFFEVPNALDTFLSMGIWDIIYEHCGYFTPVSLAHAFSTCGFQVHELRDEYCGQFLCIESSPGNVVSELTEHQFNEVEQLTDKIIIFPDKFNKKLNDWKEKLEYIDTQGQRAVIWGGGSKGITFLNFLNGAKPVECVVDINPRKHGMYATGTGQKIVPPEFLREYQPDVVFVMNAIYESEIRQILSSLGLNPELICI